MGESKQQDIRRIEDVTDDEIVDAAASAGIYGVHTSRLPALFGVDTDTLRIDLRLICVRGFRLKRYGDSGDRVGPSPREWARRLAGLSEDSIAAILSGRPQPTDNMTDDEIHRIAFGSS